MANVHFLMDVVNAPTAAHRLVNVTRDVVIASRLETAFESARRRTGLLGRDGLPASDALVIAPCSAVHTFGMRFPLDLLFTDRYGRVLKRVSAVPRSRIALCPGAFAVVECTANHPGVTDTSRGDTLMVLTDDRQASAGSLYCP